MTTTRATKRAFIRQLTKNVRDHVLNKVADMPDTWDGIELREYIADEFDRARHLSRRGGDAGDRRRLRDYRNDVLVRPL